MGSLRLGVKIAVVLALVLAILVPSLRERGLHKVRVYELQAGIAAGRWPSRISGAAGLRGAWHRGAGHRAIGR